MCISDRDIRDEFSARFVGVGEAYPGTAAGAVAFLEAGKLEQALGDVDAAIAAYQAGIDSLGENDALRGFLWSRMGSVYEAEGRWSEAAAVYTKAGGLRSYALHAGAMAAAIRAYIHAGEPTAALGAADELARTEADYLLPGSLQAQVEELRRDDSVIMMGEDLVASLFGTASGFLDEFGPSRIRDTPISEAGFSGAAIGAAMTGLRPIVDFAVSTFLYVAMDQLVNQAAKTRYCLLYTSPSPRDLSTSRMPSSA